MDELLKTAIIDSNPWWKGGFPDVQVRQREMFLEIEKFMPKKQIIGIYGLRRVGKSYLLYHLIRQLLDGKADPKSILYFSFDAFSQASLADVLSSAGELAGQKPAFIFLDEVQKLPDWAEHVKRVYDLHHPKIVVSGSETLFFRKGSNESLAGRLFEFEAKPLSFGEYLQFRGIENKPLYEKEVKSALSHYLLSGGFPELVDENDPLFIRKYIKEGVIDKAIYRDIPKSFPIEDPAALEQILNIIIANPGMMIDKAALGRELGLYRATISKYLFYLEAAFLVKSLHNFSKNRSTSEKKLKKYHPGFSPLSLGPHEDSAYYGMAVEAVCACHAGAKFFWRTPQKDEVDIVLTTPLLPVEVKYRNRPDTGGMGKFFEKFGGKSGIVITKGDEGAMGAGTGKARLVPLHKWLLEEKPV